MKVKIRKVTEDQFLVQSIPPNLLVDGKVDTRQFTSLSEALNFCRQQCHEVATIKLQEGRL